MLAVLMMLVAAAQTSGAIGDDKGVLRDRISGPFVAEQHTLSQPWPGQGVLPNIFVADLRLDGDTLWVKVKNDGELNAVGSMRIAASADSAGVNATATPALVSRLGAGESRWIPVRGFSVKQASAAGTVFALQGADSVLVSVDRPDAASISRRCTAERGCVFESNEGDNVVTAKVPAIIHGRP